MTTEALVPVQDGMDYLPRPIVSLTQLAQVRAERLTFVQSQLKAGVDFYKIEGTDKEGLSKAGAENLCDIFGFATDDAEIVDKVEDWDAPFFRYLIKTTVRNKRTGRVEGVGMGEANSHEPKYRWRWVQASAIPKKYSKDDLESRSSTLSEFTFAVEKSETTGKYGKPAAYWQQFKDEIEAGTAVKVKRKTKTGKEMDAWQIGGTLYRIPNEDAAGMVNTLVKMAKKRSKVDGVLDATHMSDRFTQYDGPEDPEPGDRHDAPAGDVIEGEIVESKAKSSPKSNADALKDLPIDATLAAEAKAREQAESAQADKPFVDRSKVWQKVMAMAKKNSTTTQDVISNMTRGEFTSMAADAMSDADVAALDKKLEGK